ncbi:MAG: coiled-coil domain-containing protein [Candidatus Hermodarchaeota archaeon]
MSEKKHASEIIENSLRSVEDNFKQFIEVLETAKTELVTLEKDKEQLSRDKKTLEEQKVQLEQDKSKLEKDKQILEEETHKLELEKREKDQKIGTMTEEQKRLLKEYEKVKVELAKFAKLAEEAESQEFDFERITALLSIFRVLVEKIWQGQPHYRVLIALHGEKKTMTREELKNTTGIGGAYVLRAVQELANVKLVDHDIDTGKVTLRQRLYSKTALEEK